MKKVIFRLVFTLSVLLQTLNASSTINACQLRDIITHGWSDTNQTLNKTIEKLGEVEIPNILSKLDKPLMADDNSTDIFAIPKLLLTRDDYKKLFVYSKYLEHKREEDTVVSYYINATQGLHDVDSHDMITLIYKIVMNTIIVRSLKTSLDTRFFTKISKKLLSSKLKQFLIQDNKILLKAIESEKDIVVYYTKQIKLEKASYLLNEEFLNIYKQQMIKSIHVEYTDLANAIQNNTLDKRIEKRKHEISKHKKITTSISMWLLGSKLKLYDILSMKHSKDDYNTLAHYLVDESKLIETPSLNNMYRDYAEMVEENKQILERLDSK